MPGFTPPPAADPARTNADPSDSGPTPSDPTPSDPTPRISTGPGSSPALDPRPVLPEDARQRAVLEALRDSGPGALAERMGIEILEFGAERTVARMPVEGNTQPYGLLHGGASAVLAETVGSIASALHAGPDRIALGLELGCTHHRAVRAGHVTATATPLSLGRSVASYDIRVVDDQARPVCTARLTCVLRDR